MPARYDPGPPVRGAEDRFGIPNPRESGSVIGADRRRSGPSCVLPKALCSLGPLPRLPLHRLAKHGYTGNILHHGLLQSLQAGP